MQPIEKLRHALGALDFQDDTIITLTRGTTFPAEIDELADLLRPFYALRSVTNPCRNVRSATEALALMFLNKGSFLVCSRVSQIDDVQMHIAHVLERRAPNAACDAAHSNWIYMREVSDPMNTLQWVKEHDTLVTIVAGAIANNRGNCTVYPLVRSLDDSALDYVMPGGRFPR
jgi:hypothetical protein